MVRVPQTDTTPPRRAKTPGPRTYNGIFSSWPPGSSRETASVLTRCRARLFVTRWRRRRRRRRDVSLGCTVTRTQSLASVMKQRKISSSRLYQAKIKSEGRDRTRKARRTVGWIKAAVFHSEVLHAICLPKTRTAERRHTLGTPEINPISHIRYRTAP